MLQLRRSKVLSDAAVVAACAILIKIAGAAKVVFSAHLFGAGDDFDMFVIAFLVPSFLGDVLAGSIAASLIPTLIQVRENDGERAAHELYSSVVICIVVMLSAMAAVAAAASGPLIALLGSGFGPAKAHTTRLLLLWMMPVIPLSGISGTWRAMLNSKERFAVAAAVPLCTPLASIALLFAAGAVLRAFSLALGASIGTLMEVCLLGAAMRWNGLRVAPVMARWSQPMRQVVTQYVPMATGSVILSGSNLVDQTMAAMLAAGSVSALNFGTRVTGVILAVGPAALSTAILPRFSKLTAGADWPALRSAVRRYALGSLALSIPLTAACMALSEPIARIIFQRGAFTAADTHLVARVQFWSLPAAPISMLLALVVRLISSLKWNELLLRMAALAFAANIALDYLLMQRMGVAGIALATALVSLLSLAFLSYLVFRRVKTRALAAY